MKANLPLMLIIDGHEDLAWNATVLRRDLTTSLEAIRAKEGPLPTHGEGTATVCLPALREAGVRVVMATVFTRRYSTASPTAKFGYHSPTEAYAQAMAQLAVYHEWAARGEVTIIRSRDDLDHVLRGESPAPGLVLLMESADPLNTPDDLPDFVEQGVRIIGPAWRETRYAGGAGEPGPLTELGRELLAAMEAQGVALDVSHLAEEAFWEALELFHGPVIASHANCRAIIPTERQLSDEMIRALAARDAVIGLVFYNRFIRAGWTDEHPKEVVTLADLLRHAEHITALAGYQHVAIGSDLDGGLGRESIPCELDAITDLPCFATVLAQQFAPTAVEAIMGGNWLRKLREILPE